MNSGHGSGPMTSGGMDPSIMGPPTYGIPLDIFNKWDRVTTAHAACAALVWVFLIPFGGILLRLNIKSPWMVRIHGYLQIFSYCLFIAAVGMGIWLVQQMKQGFNMWNDPHPRLGLAIFAIAFFQPIFGYVHHRMFKKQQSDFNTGKTQKKPGRTALTHAHLWIGRLLIVLGIVNGGLGLDLASRSPFTAHQNAKVIAYSVCSAVMFCIYAVVSILFEVRRAKGNKTTTQAAPKNALRESDQSSEERLAGDKELQP